FLVGKVEVGLRRKAVAMRKTYTPIALLKKQRRPTYTKTLLHHGDDVSQQIVEAQRGGQSGQLGARRSVRARPPKARQRTSGQDAGRTRYEQNRPGGGREHERGHRPDAGREKPERQEC